MIIEIKFEDVLDYACNYAEYEYNSQINLGNFRSGFQNDFELTAKREIRKMIEKLNIEIDDEEIERIIKENIVLVVREEVEAFVRKNVIKKLKDDDNVSKIIDKKFEEAKDKLSKDIAAI